MFTILKALKIESSVNECNQRYYKASLYNVFGLILLYLLITTVLAEFQRLNDLFNYYSSCCLSFIYFRHFNNFFHFSNIYIYSDIVRLAHPRSEDSQCQETFLAPSPGKETWNCDIDAQTAIPPYQP